MTLNCAEDFIKKFHSSEGITVAQKRKNFFMLLHKNASLKDNAEVLQMIATNLKPKTFLEDLFKLDFLIYFRRTKELYDLLKNGDNTTISKIARHSWFFKEAFSSVKAEELVNEILPCMSFSMRMKVLKKLSKYLDGEKFDEIYDAVELRYGKFLASNFIIGCSPTKLREILKDHPGKFKYKQFMILYKKDPELIKHLIDVAKWEYRYNIPPDFLKHIYNVDRDLYNYIEKKLELNHLELGRRMTKKFVQNNRNNIIENPPEYKTFLHMKVVTRKLGWDAEKLFSNSLPPQITDSFPSVLAELLHYFPKKFHYRLIKPIESHYNIKYIDHPSLINERILGYISDNEERALLAKVKVDEGDDSYIKYLLTKDSIPKIKEKINFTSDIYDRAKFTEVLVETCYINKDIDSLLEVIKYFFSRHKNDTDIHMEFINKIETSFGYKNFNEEMWNHFNDLSTIHLLKFENNLDTFKKIQTQPLIKFNKGISNYQKLSYLEFLFNKGELIDELIVEYFLNKNPIIYFGKYDQNFEKYLLLCTINNSENIYRNNRNGMTGVYSSLIKNIGNWNNQYPNDQLSLYDFPVLLEWFNHTIRNETCIDLALINIFKKKIFTTEENKYRNEYLQIYWERHDIFGKNVDYLWFLKYEPTQIVNNFDKFISNFNFNKPIRKRKRRRIMYKTVQFEKIPRLELSILNFLKKYSHLQLDNTLIDFCVSKLNDNTYLEPKSKFVMFLSVVIEPEKFAELADSFKPANKTLDLKNETEVKLYNLQSSLGQNFKNTKSHKVLSSLLNYCVGDYFKYAMRSLYSIIYRTPENLLPQYLDYLSKKAISVRKHALYFTCELTSITKTEEMLRIMNQRENTETLRKYMFKSIIRYFIKNPSDQIFDMVKSNMNFITKTDEESLRMIVDSVERLPQNYKVRYIVCSWEFVENTVDIWQKREPLKSSLLKYSTNIELMEEFSLDFIVGIIQKHFLTEEEIQFNLMSKFMFHAFSYRDDKNLILDTIFDIIKDKEKSTILRFFRDWYKKIMVFSTDIEHLTYFFSWFSQQIHPVHHFRDYIKLFLSRTKAELTYRPYEELGTKIFPFLNDLINNHGPYIIHIFFEEFKSSINHFFSRKVHMYDFFYNLIRQSPTSFVAIFILNIIEIPKSEQDCLILFNNTLRVIKEMDDSGVQINIQNTFKDYLVSKEFQDFLIHASSSS